MHIVVPIKQVPETSNVQMDRETGTMIRSGSDSIVNPLDLYALETALRIKEEQGGKITVITMGPPSAVKVLKEAVAMGCDSAVHLSDKDFGGADTWATSGTLAAGIEKLSEISRNRAGIWNAYKDTYRDDAETIGIDGAGDVDFIITGERATDGDTGQVGPGIASWLDMSLVTYVSKLVQITDTHIQAERLIEEGYQIVQAALPAVLTVVKEIASPRLPTLKGKKRAMKLEIPKWGASDLDLDAEDLGLKGSPTRVVKIETPKISRKCTVVKAGDDQTIRSAVDQLMEFLEQKDLLPSKIAPPRESMNQQKSAASRRETNNENLSRKKAATGNAPTLKDSGRTGGDA